MHPDKTYGFSEGLLEDAHLTELTSNNYQLEGYPTDRRKILLDFKKFIEVLKIA